MMFKINQLFNLLHYESTESLGLKYLHLRETKELSKYGVNLIKKWLNK